MMTKILFITNSEYGQASIMLAMAAELLTRPEMEVHILSFEALRLRAKKLQSTSVNSTLSFTALDGLSQGDAYWRLVNGCRDAIHPPVTSGDFSGYDKVDKLLGPWEEAEYMSLYEQCKKNITDFDPDALVLDPVLQPAIDACRMLGRTYIIGSPMQALDIAKRTQPWLKELWYYPCLGSGIPFPLSRQHFLLNIKATFSLIASFVKSGRMANLRTFRKAHGLKGNPPIQEVYNPEVQFITPSILEVEYPMKCPKNIALCGPIVQDPIPLETSDPKLNEWIGQAPTVMINMGSHFEYDEDSVRAVIGGCMKGLPDGYQVVWKLKGKKLFEVILEEIVKKEKEHFWITDWLEADPSAILLHAHVVCSVHHGGANSFFESCLAGVPQIILPQWYDLYDNACRAEYHGFGNYANKQTAPAINESELAAALSRITGAGEEAKVYKRKAEAVAVKCKEAGGSKAAVDVILAQIAGQTKTVGG